MDLSFARDPKIWSKAIESMRGKIPMTEENIRKAYEAAEKGEEEPTEKPVVEEPKEEKKVKKHK